MSKPASAETLLRQERRRTKELAKELTAAKQLVTHYRDRAATAEQTVAEWKARFDALLALPRFDSAEKP